MDVFFSTGEPSGDRIAATVADHLRRTFGRTLDLAGLVGPSASAAGVRNILEGPGLEGSGRASAGGEVRGFAAWSRRLESAVAALRAHPPKLLVAVTHPTFNLPLAASTPPNVARVMIGPPEIWAWEVNALGRAVGRALKAMAGGDGKLAIVMKAASVTSRRGPLALASFDELLCLTPMNAAAYGDLKARTGASAGVVQVRHPAAGLERPASWREQAEDLRRRLGLAGGEHLLGIFPGSRAGEIRLLLPTMLRAAERIARLRKDVRPVVSVAEGSLQAPIAECVRGGPLASLVILARVPSADLLCASCHAILASGTLTLEAALLGARGTVAYTLPWATRFLLRPLFRPRRIAARMSPFALPNAIAAWGGARPEELPYPEVTLGDFRASTLARTVLAGLPTGPHGEGCPPPPAAGIVRSLRQALCPSHETPSVEQSVERALRLVL